MVSLNSQWCYDWLHITETGWVNDLDIASMVSCAMIRLPLMNDFMSDNSENTTCFRRSTRILLLFRYKIYLDTDDMYFRITKLLKLNYIWKNDVFFTECADTCPIWTGNLLVCHAEVIKYYCRSGNFSRVRFNRESNKTWTQY